MTNVFIITNLRVEDIASKVDVPFTVQFANVTAEQVDAWVTSRVVDYVDSGGSRTILPFENIVRLQVAA